MNIEFKEFCYNGEHLSRIVVINVEEGLQDKSIYLEFQKPDCKKLVSQKLDIVEGKCDYYLCKELLDQIGYLKLQLVAKGDNFIKKSKIYEYYVATSINATDETVSEFKDVLTGLEESKADSLVYENNQLQLLANGKPVGEPITISGGGGGTTDYEKLENRPIEKLVSMDYEKPIILRDLESNVYVLHGYFKPFATSDVLMAAQTPIQVGIAKSSEISYVQLMFPFNNMIQYFEISDNSYTENSLSLNDLAKLLQT